MITQQTVGLLLPSAQYVVKLCTGVGTMLECALCASVQDHTRWCVAAGTIWCVELSLPSAEGGKTQSSLSTFLSE